MNIELNEFEKNYIISLLNCELIREQIDRKDFKYKDNTIDLLLKKLTEKPKEENAKMKGISYAVENSSDELIIRRPEKGRLTKLDYDIPDDAVSEIRGMQNYLVEKHLEEMMEQFRPNLNIPFVKR